MSVQDSIKKTYTRAVRIRVMGLLRNADQLLMVKHSGLNASNELWLPPGGGVEFGVSLKDSVVNEFREECSIDVEVGEILFGNEFISADFHAIEHFFEITQWSGKIEKGSDPELGSDQIIEEVRFMTFEELKSMPKGNVHEIFDAVDSLDHLLTFRGFFNLSKYRLK